MRISGSWVRLIRGEVANKNMSMQTGAPTAVSAQRGATLSVSQKMDLRQNGYAVTKL